MITYLLKKIPLQMLTETDHPSSTTLLHEEYFSSLSDLPEQWLTPRRVDHTKKIPDCEAS
jgi:hypothetical protein